MSSHVRWAVGLRCSLSGEAGEPDDPVFLFPFRNSDRLEETRPLGLELAVLFQTGHPADYL